MSDALALLDMRKRLLLARGELYRMHLQRIWADLPMVSNRPTEAPQATQKPGLSTIPTEAVVSLALALFGNARVTHWLHQSERTLTVCRVMLLALSMFHPKTDGTVRQRTDAAGYRR